jgi:hypothetical protein
MEYPDPTSAETSHRPNRSSEPKLPWPQLLRTGRVFQNATDAMKEVLGDGMDPTDIFSPVPSFSRNEWARTTRAFIDSNRLVQPRQPGQASRVSADRACWFLFDWVEKTKMRRREAERHRKSAFFSQESDPASAGQVFDKQESLDQLYCKDIVILLTCILGFQSVVELRQLTEVSVHLVLLASLLHRLFYAPPAGFSFEVFRKEAMDLLEVIGRRFDVGFDGRKA